MRRLAHIFVAMSLVSTTAFAQSKHGKSAAKAAPAPVVAPTKVGELPQEVKGSDPKPDTDVAAAFLGNGRYEDAIRQSRLALGRDERYTPALVVMAKGYYYLKKYELARSICDTVRNIDPNNAEAYNLIGFLALTQDDRISATAAFKKAVEFKPDFAAAWDNLTAQYLLAKNYDGAVDAAEHSTKLQPNSAKAFLNLGSAYRGKLRYTDADTAYKKAVDLKKDYADAQFDLGILYLDAKEYPGLDMIQRLNVAINYLTKYKELAASKLTKDDPADTYIADAKKQIDREQKNIERKRKQKERDAQKAAPPPEGTAPAAPPAAAPADVAKPAGDKK